MANAAVDLTDPQAGAPVDPANADELLSQMAGDEIDRLLAEADVEPEEKSPPTAQASATENIAPAADTIPTAALAPQLDALFDQLNAEAAAPASPTNSAGPTAAAVTAATPPAAAAMSVMQTAEAAMHAGSPTSTASPAASSRFFSITHLLLLPLELLNEPFQDCSDSLRQGLGWIGIVTTVNALAVLAYILLFRRH